MTVLLGYIVTILCFLSLACTLSTYEKKFAIKQYPSSSLIHLMFTASLYCVIPSVLDLILCYFVQ